MYMYLVFLLEGFTVLYKWPLRAPTQQGHTLYLALRDLISGKRLLSTVFIIIINLQSGVTSAAHIIQHVWAT